MRPTAVQPASAKPVRYASPGRPMSNQPLISDASADKAVSQGPKLRPPIKYSLLDLLDLLRYTSPTIRSAKK